MVSWACEGQLTVRWRSNLKSFLSLTLVDVKLVLLLAWVSTGLIIPGSCNLSTSRLCCYLKRNKSLLKIYIVVLSVSCLTHSSAMIFFWLMVTRYTDPSIGHRLMCLTSTAVTDPCLMLVQSGGCPLDNNFLNWRGKPLYSHNITK